MKIKWVFYLGAVVARFEHGWVRLHRKLLNQEWTDALDAIGKGLFVELLLMANWKDSDKPLFKHKEICLKAGQIATSSKELCQRLRVTRNQLRDRLNRLETLGTITIKTDNHGTIITICNFVSYQESKDDDYQRNHQPINIQQDNQPTSNRTHSKELKNLRIKEGGEVESAHPYFYFQQLYKERLGRELIWPDGVYEKFIRFCANHKEGDLKIIIRNFFASKSAYYVERAFDPEVMIADANKLRGFGEDGITYRMKRK